MSKEIRSLLEERFHEVYKNKRLLAVQLNGFSHSVFYDNGDGEDNIMVDRVSFYAPEIDFGSKSKKLFDGFGHGVYQNNPKEYVWITPEER
jgi:hypothetical protein